MRARLFAAGTLVATPERCIAGGGVLVRDGVIESVLGSPGAVRRAAKRHSLRPVDLTDCAVTPGLVNAHAHLELSGLRGRLPRDAGFVAWIGAVLAARKRRRASDDERDVLAGAHRALETGTTSIGDIDSSGAVQRVAGAARVRLRIYREVLDAWDEARTDAVLARAARPVCRGRRRHAGISPHAPYTTSARLLRGVRRLARERRLALSVHWAETELERDWLLRGKGELASVLGRSPKRSGLDLLADAGLLSPRTSLVHGNHPTRSEPARIAAAGCVLVHCPGTHAFFGRAPFPWRRYERAGVRIALGTDSLASNEDLDLGREMRLAREAAPWLAPARVWAMATVHAARAVALGGRIGALRRGFAADLVAFDGVGNGAEGVLETLTVGGGRLRGGWIAGRSAFRPT